MEARRIFDKYVKPGAQYELNLPGGIAAELDAQISSGDPDVLLSKLFGKAQLEAFRMLQSHSFMRWVSSVEWLPEKQRCATFLSIV